MWFGRAGLNQIYSDCGEEFQDFLRHNEQLVRGSAICSSSASLTKPGAKPGGCI